MAKSSPAARSEAKKRAILRATGDLIAERGIDGFNLSEVSRLAGINRALIYYYFQNRDNLIVQAVDDILERLEEGGNELSANGVESSLRLHIAHPEVSRVFFELLLRKRPLLPLGDRLTDTIEAVEKYRVEAGVDIPYDATFLFVMLALAQYAWPISREAISDVLGVDVEEADESFIAAARWTTDMALSQIQPSTN